MQLKNVELVKLGHRIRRARKLLGFSQKDFSAKCGLDRSYLGGVERGNRNVTFGVLCRICDGLYIVPLLVNARVGRLRINFHVPI